ncbi:MAG: DUF3320 domain-containing protein [Paludibacter sp.]
MENVLINVEFVYLPVVNFAMQQNRVSLIRLLKIENKSDNLLKDIRIVLNVDPEFTSIIPYIIETIPPHETVRVDLNKINLSTSFFSQLTERIIGNFKLEIYSEEKLAFLKVYPIDILAFDQWGGLTVLPEMLSSFITPNNPAIIPIIKRASVILEQWTGKPSLDEYQSRIPDRVRKQIAAIYTAISELNITYSSVPASFEDYGQRVRLVDAVLANKLGTCLDMALLYASCIESIGIHPLIIITKGHAFTGAWLVSETFPDSIIDDVSYLKKRIADGINEITLVEATCMNSGSNTDFDQAVKFANSKILDSDNFVLALDVKRSRFSGIRPLPQRVFNERGWVIQDEVNENENELINPESVNPYDLTGIDNNAQVTKQLFWERKLLDLSLRNNLLNTRITKNTLQLISADIDRFEDALAIGEEFQITPKPTDWDNPLYDFGVYQSIDSTDPIIELIKSEISQKRLRSYLNETELSYSLLHLYRASRLSLEENGANTLYLALGLLKWFESPTSERPRYAPILLLPVEIIRKSATRGYVIRSREEDTMLNITLLEMLRQNFGISIPGLDPLPIDDSGVDVKRIYAIIRKGIMNQKKWDVEEQAILGIFSFNKFIMWNDIHNNANILKKNKIVSSLINGKLEWDVQDGMIDASVLDKSMSPSEIVLPINADSSQLEAIYEGINDKTFILHGPPGTGKSQTITNIIANALYKGKRVLFVAEKMAALSVVQNRLTAIGLNPFCLELHSNKAKKTTILSQLKETTEVVKNTSPQNFQDEATRLLGLRTHLNTYIEALHKKYPFGISLYDAITRYLSIESEIEFNIPQTLIDELSENKLFAWKEAIEKLISLSNAYGHPYLHPLADIKISTYSSQLKDDINNQINQTLDLINKIKRSVPFISSLFGENKSSYTKFELKIISQLFEKLLSIPELTPALLTTPMLVETLNEYKLVSKNGKERNELNARVTLEYSTEILFIEASKLLADWKQLELKWFLPKLIGKNKIKKQLKYFSLIKSIKDEKVIPLLSDIIEFKKRENYVTKFADKLVPLFGLAGKKDEENWETIDRIIEDAFEINSFIILYSKNIAATTQLKESLAKQLYEGIKTFNIIHKDDLNSVRILFQNYQIVESQLESTLGIPRKVLYDDLSSEWIDHLNTKLNLWLSGLERLKEWFLWLQVIKELEDYQINFIFDKYQTENISTEKLMSIVEKSINHACIDYILSKETSLDLFKGKLFDDVITKFKKLSADFEEITKKELIAKLTANIPDFTKEASQNSEVGILQKNIRNNGRGMSIRKIFDSIPTLVSRMCPCMLMSPISVAQYIDPNADKFDLIIFDEASQMPTYEAIGAIARGKNVIVVGDPKQMPPTNFFSTNTIDEENIEMEDLESILDDCLALSMPSKYLLWHYRSKHESLIAFSNSEYYDNKLLTFPSPDNQESKVRFVKINGFYDKGKSRQNKAEAQAVVDEIARRLKDETLRKKSIGVVTFSSVQQSLIEDLLSDLYVFNPEIERLALESEEPLFIKNLENVQGDERDVILFSIGYGPDKEGRVSMNFGPLNRLGGERRLNVAVSRARYEMIIYSTLKSDQIDLNRTSSIGVAGLKRFLEYSEKGERIITDKQTSIIKTMAIENLIAIEIRKHGYTVHTNIGCSGYKIDLGIVDDSKSSNYILGILCDGDNYRQTKTARDREIVQNTVLKQLGWNIYRIWTMDWWENPKVIIEEIQQIIKKIKQDGFITITETATHEDKKIFQNVLLSNLEQTANLTVDEEQPEETVLHNNGISYQSATLPFSGIHSDYFMFTEYKHKIISQIEQIMEIEAPISRTLLCKKVLNSWGISRLGQRLDGYLEMILMELPYYRTHQNSVIWLSKEQCDNFEVFRLNSNRDAVDIPPEEVAIAMKQIVQDQISLPTNDLARLAAQLFGFSRFGTNVEASMYKGIQEAVKRNYLKIDNGKAVVI